MPAANQYQYSLREFLRLLREDIVIIVVEIDGADSMMMEEEDGLLTFNAMLWYSFNDDASLLSTSMMLLLRSGGKSSTNVHFPYVAISRHPHELAVADVTMISHMRIQVRPKIRKISARFCTEFLRS